MLLSRLGSQPEMTPAAETMTALERGIAPVVRGGLAALLSTVFFFLSGVRLALFHHSRRNVVSKLGTNYSV